MQTSDTFGREIAKLRLDRLSDRTASHYKMDIKLPPLRLCRSGRARISSRSRKSPAAGRRNNAVRGNQPCPVGLIIHGDEAEQILEDGQADLIAAGREILYNLDWPLDAALKPGIEGPFRTVPPQFGWWLGTRAKRDFGTKPSTWRNGLKDTGKVL